MIYRIIQELVNNVIKHARAGLLEIVFERDQNQLKITVRDNGVGFLTDGFSETKIRESRYGLFAVKERVNNLGGEIIINSKIKDGTTVIVRVPLNMVS